MRYWKMAKTNGTLKFALVLIPIAAAIIGGCYAYTTAVSSRCHANAVSIAAADARADGMREDIRDIKIEQRRQSAKLDDILEKLP
jgi:hypothetical protein